MSLLRVAGVQAEAVPGDVAGNLAAAVRWTERAAAQGARLVVLPEAFTTGYDEAVFDGPLPSSDLAWCAPVQAAVDAAGATVLLNTPLDHGTRRTLSTVVLRPGSAPIAAYAKQHLYDAERTHFTAGEHGTTIAVEGHDVALSVCYDANFPEHAADAAAAGIDIYANSGAYFPGGGHRRDLHYRARALDNGVYVVFAGLIGRPYDFIGGSAIVDPEGRILDQVEPGVEGLAVADIDPRRVTKVRAAQRMWADRRPSLGERRRISPVRP
ncbi:MAG: carbon-nitrogen hydrolase family protein [Nocardioides sp.]